MEVTTSPPRSGLDLSLALIGCGRSDLVEAMDSIGNAASAFALLENCPECTMPQRYLGWKSTPAIPTIPAEPSVQMTPSSCCYTSGQAQTKPGKNHPIDSQSCKKNNCFWSHSVLCSNRYLRQSLFFRPLSSIRKEKICTLT